MTSVFFETVRRFTNDRRRIPHLAQKQGRSIPCPMRLRSAIVDIEYTVVINPGSHRSSGVCDDQIT
ncbi:MAG: hypothetical protein MI923_01925 [Phycisphaerales bacterium]|nr:hypothetical protein [Phycisphaerales bacterium]